MKRFAIADSDFKTIVLLLCIFLVMYQTVYLVCRCIQHAGLKEKRHSYAPLNIISTEAAWFQRPGNPAFMMISVMTTWHGFVFVLGQLAFALSKIISRDRHKIMYL